MAIELGEFGRTGHLSTRVIFGGAALGDVSQRVADETLDVLLSYGVNHLDVASSYGEAEVRVGAWLQREPGRFFLATKGDERTKERAREELHRSLDRLGVDHVDLWQLHSLADPIEWDIALSPGGAIEAALEARDEGLIRWVGVTGHGSGDPDDQIDRAPAMAETPAHAGDVVRGVPRAERHRPRSVVGAKPPRRLSGQCRGR